MTLQDAVQILTSRDPNRGYIVEKSINRPATFSTGAVSYVVAVLPAPNGDPCARYTGSTLEEAIQRAILDMPEAATVDDNRE